MKIEPCFGLSFIVWEDERLTNFELELRYRLPDDGNTGVEIRRQSDLTGNLLLQAGCGRPTPITDAAYCGTQTRCHSEIASFFSCRKRCICEGF